MSDSYEHKKENARKNYISRLSKEDLDMDLNDLTDKELKRLYVICQKLRQRGNFPYHVIKKCDFETEMKNGRLQYVSFRGTSNVRPLSLKEYFVLEKFVKENPNTYPHFQDIR